MPEEALEIGAPATVRWRLTASAGGIELALILTDKAANRMPEAGFCEITPQDGAAWRLEKTGLWIDPQGCPPAGGSALHAIFAAEAQTAAGRLALTPLDSALIAPAGRDFMTFERSPAAWADGARLVLYNNKWGTNFPMWWEGDLVSRIRLSL